MPGTGPEPTGIDLESPKTMTDSRFGATWTLFMGMLREEWRLHSELFGGRRFAAFPLFVFVLAAGGAWLLGLTGTPTAAIVSGVHVLVFVFGMHIGTIGLVGHDSLQNLLGDVTLLLSASRTLPLSPRRLLGVFLLKDVVYYVALFLVPIVAGLALTGGLVLAPVGGSAVARAPQVLFSLTATLALGFAIVFGMIALRTRGRVGTVVVVVLVAAAVVGWLVGVDLVAWTPYALVDPVRTIGTFGAIRALAPVIAFAAAGMAVYDPTYRKPARTHTATFSTWRRRLRDPDGLLTKSLFDVSRSSGGLVKVPFSAGIVLAIAVTTVEITGALTGRPPAPGITMGSLLGLTSFTTYNWLTQFDELTSYLAYPLEITEVLRAKYRAFVVLGLPVGLAYYLLAMVWYRPPLLDLVAGISLLIGLQAYLFGVTVYLTGLRPSEFLFDTVLFTVFTMAVAVPLVPVLISGFVFTPLIDPLVAGGLVAAGGVLTGVGSLLASRALGRWRRQYREGI